MSFHVEPIPNRGSRPTILLRESWREGKRVRKKTLGNLTRLPSHIVEGIKILLDGGVAYKDAREAFPIKRSLPHGHVAAAYGAAKKLGLDRILHRKRSRVRDIALGTIVTQVLFPGSELAASRALSAGTASTSLGRIMGLGKVAGGEALSMLGWLGERKPWIEKSLCNRHLSGDAMVLYDVASGCFGADGALDSDFGRSRGKKQAAFGLLCSKDGCPVACEVFAGNAPGPATAGARVRKIKERFGTGGIALVGDRGRITAARIREKLVPGGLDWISALKRKDIRRLTKKPEGGEPDLRLEDVKEGEVREIRSGRHPGERLMVCLDPRLREERKAKREAFLCAAEEILEGITRLVRNGSLRGAGEINRMVGREANRKKVEKHFSIAVTDTGLIWERNEEKIRAEAALDGIYVVRTSLDASQIGAEEAVSAYRSLSRVERAFRSMKTVSSEVRPAYAHSGNHLRGCVFLCMLAYYLEWHLRKMFAPLALEDDDREGAEDGFRTLLQDLGTLSLNEVAPPGRPDYRMHVTAEPTPVQQRAFELLGVDEREHVPGTATG